jgi:transcriptional regulator with XRE-family HTH domain
MPRKKRDPRQPDAVDLAVGINVRTWRIARGLSQAELAKRLGITFQQVQKYEIGHNRISTGRLAKAAVVLGVPMAALFHGADAEDPAHALLADNRAFRLAQAFQAIKSPTFRLAVVQLVEKLAGSVPLDSDRRQRRVASGSAR